MKELSGGCGGGRRTAAMGGGEEKRRWRSAGIGLAIAGDLSPAAMCVVRGEFCHCFVLWFWVCSVLGLKWVLLCAWG